MNRRMTTIAATVLACSFALNCPGDDNDDSDLFLLLGLAALANSNPCTTTITSSTTTTNSNSSIKNHTVTSAGGTICSSECVGTTCAIELTFETAGTYSVTVNQALQRRRCGSTTHTRIVDASYGALGTDAFTLTSATTSSSTNPANTTSETLTAGTKRGLNATLTTSYPSGFCSGGSFTFTGTTTYSAAITKTN